MASKEIHQGDTGTVFELTVKDGTDVVDVSLATVKQIKFLKPDNTTLLTKTALFTTDGTDGKIRYVSVAADLDQAGKWKWQAYVELPGGKWHSDILEFTVYANLAASA